MQTVSFAGDSYSIPTVRGDRPWSGLSDFVIAAASKCINTGGGNFTLLADINLGATYGLVSTYYKSRTSNIADAGQIRLANADTIRWRNAANDGNLSLSLSTNALQFNGVLLATAAAALTASRALVSDGSGNVSVATTTATEIGYVNGVTSAIQTQLNLKAPLASPTFTGTVTLPVTADRALQTGTASVLEASAVTKTELGYVSGVTSAIQTQLDSKGVGTVTAVNGTANQITSSGGATPTLAIASPVTLPGAMTAGGAIAMGTNKITGLGNGTAATDAAAFGQIFTGFQAIVQATSTTGFSTTSSTFQNTNLAATITPTSASHRIKISVCSDFRNQSAAANNAVVTIKRGSTDISPGGAVGGFAAISNGTGSVYSNCGISYIDSPATTSATTYTVCLKNSDNATTVQFGSLCAQAITLEEIV